MTSGVFPGNVPVTVHFKNESEKILAEKLIAITVAYSFATDEGITECPCCRTWSLTWYKHEGRKIIRCIKGCVRFRA